MNERPLACVGALLRGSLELSTDWTRRMRKHRYRDQLAPHNADVPGHWANGSRSEADWPRLELTQWVSGLIGSRFGISCCAEKRCRWVVSNPQSGAFVMDAIPICGIQMWRSSFAVGFGVGSKYGSHGKSARRGIRVVNIVSGNLAFERGVDGANTEDFRRKISIHRVNPAASNGGAHVLPISAEYGVWGVESRKPSWIAAIFPQHSVIRLRALHSPR